MIQVYAPQKERLNLLGCFVEKILSRNSEAYSGNHRFKELKLLIIGSGMAVNLDFHGDRISVYPASHDMKAHVVIKANLKTFLDITLGASPVLLFLKRKLRLKGNPIKVLRVLKWLRV